MNEDCSNGHRVSQSVSLRWYEEKKRKNERDGLWMRYEVLEVDVTKPRENGKQVVHMNTPGFRAKTL